LVTEAPQDFPALSGSVQFLRNRVLPSSIKDGVSLEIPPPPPPIRTFPNKASWYPIEPTSLGVVWRKYSELRKVQKELRKKGLEEERKLRREANPDRPVDED